jgi:hypothetical protein
MKTNQIVPGENFPHHKEGEGGHLNFDEAPLNRMIGLTDIFLVQNNEQKYKLKNSEDSNRV